MEFRLNNLESTQGTRKSPTWSHENNTGPYEIHEIITDSERSESLFSWFTTWKTWCPKKKDTAPQSPFFVVQTCHFFGACFLPWILASFSPYACHTH